MQTVRKIAAITAVGIGLGLAIAAPAGAQKLLVTTSSLTTAAALEAAQAALARCQKDGFTVAVAVVDRGGAPLALLRDNLAGVHTSGTAVDKAWTAVSFRTDTLELADTTQPGKPSSGVRNLPHVVAVGGGLAIRAKGAIVGGIGVSGAPGGDADAACAKVGIAKIGDALELE
jgi:uncharacterized protein GlcG (DUF336 family)